MDELDALLEGIDPARVRRGLALEEADHQLLRRLVDLRKELKLSQATVAERLGISQASVAAFERYDNDPKLSTIRKYAQAVGLLLAHAVEVDRGQLEGLPEGSAWSPAWPEVVGGAGSSSSAELQATVTASSGTRQSTVSARRALALAA